MKRFVPGLAVLLLTVAALAQQVLCPTPRDAVEGFWALGANASDKNLLRFGLLVVKGDFTEAQERFYYDKLLGPFMTCLEEGVKASPPLLDPDLPSWQVVHVAEKGAGATVQAKESFTLEGRRKSLEVTYKLVKREGEWQVDPASAPDLTAEIARLVGAGPKMWESFLRSQVDKHGVGPVVLSLARYAASQR